MGGGKFAVVALLIGAAAIGLAFGGGELIDPVTSRLPDLQEPRSAHLAAGAAVVLVLVVATALFALENRDPRNPAEVERRIGRALTRLEIAGLDGHVVVCGGGELAHELVDELARRSMTAVVVERDAAHLRTLRAFLPYVLEGDAREAETFRQVRAERAVGVIVCDAKRGERRRIAAAARQANPGLVVVSADSGQRAHAVVDALIRQEAARPRAAGST